MQLMRIGAVGAEKPVVRVDDTHYVDVSDLTADFDERFFGSGGIARLAGPVAERIATGDVRRPVVRTCTRRVPWQPDGRGRPAAAAWRCSRRAAGCRSRWAARTSS